MGVAPVLVIVNAAVYPPDQAVTFHPAETMEALAVVLTSRQHAMAKIAIRERREECSNAILSRR